MYKAREIKVEHVLFVMYLHFLTDYQEHFPVFKNKDGSLGQCPAH